MNSELPSKVIFATIMSLGFAVIVFSRYRAEIETRSSDNDRQRYSPYISGSILPMCIFALIILELIFHGTQSAAQVTLSMCFGIFLHISLYYIFLMAVSPFLHKYINARACAMLWMLPNYLYCTTSMKVSKPLLVLRASGNLVWIFFCVWLAGFSFVLIRKTIAHLIFRSRIIKNAVPVSDTAILELWNNEIKWAQIKKTDFKLITSPNVTTPLSIGLFRKTTLVVLPEQNYTSEELSLIFRHEIIHIGREDAWTKFFLVFCSAMCWFNPLMWIAMRKSANDLELSCDETVLLEADETLRRQYANLILNTADDECGFSTCLSASASAIRYRLKNIMKPKKKFPGALTVGLVYFLLYMSCGYIALSYGNHTGAEVIYQSRDTDLYTLKHITIIDNSNSTVLECTDTKAFHEYMADLTIDNLTGNYSLFGNEKQLLLTYNTPEGTLSVDLSNHYIRLLSVYGKGTVNSYYYLPDGLDWEYLNTLFETKL